MCFPFLFAAGVQFEDRCFDQVAGQAWPQHGPQSGSWTVCCWRQVLGWYQDYQNYYPGWDHDVCTILYNRVNIWQASDTHAYICTCIFVFLLCPTLLGRGSIDCSVSRTICSWIGIHGRTRDTKGGEKPTSIASSPAPSYWQDAQSVHDCDINFGTPATKRDDSPDVESTLPAAGGSFETRVNAEMGLPPAKASKKKDATYWRRLGYHSLGSMYIQIFKSHAFLKVALRVLKAPFQTLTYLLSGFCWLRMRRYCVPKPGGDLKCSSEVLRLWKNDSILSNQASNKHAVPMLAGLLWIFCYLLLPDLFPFTLLCHTVPQGEKLREVLLKCDGDWSLVETTVKRWSSKVKSENKGGAWITKHQLKETYHWSKTGTQLLME